MKKKSKKKAITHKKAKLAKPAKVTAKSKPKPLKKGKAVAKSSSVKKTATKKAKAIKKLVKPTKVTAKPKPKSLKKGRAVAKSSSVKQAVLKKNSTIGVENKRILDLKKELAYLNAQKEEAHLIKDVKGQHYCHDEHCDQPAVTDIYCRYHYLALWPKIQHRKNLLKNSYLLKTTHYLIRTFGEKALNFMLNDFKSEKSLESALKEMNLNLLKEDTAPSPPEEAY